MLTNEVSHGIVVADNRNCYRCCGIKYKQWILTSGLMLCPYVSPEDLKSSDNLWSFHSSFDFSHNDKNHLSASDIDFDQLIKEVRNKPFKVLSRNDEKFNPSNQKVSNRLSAVSNKEVLNLNSSDAYTIGIFRSSLINDYITNSFSDWQLCLSQEEFQDTSTDLIQYLLSVFLLLQVEDQEIRDDYKEPLRYFLKLCNDRQNIFRGYEIVVESTPFTIPQFYNSWSKGIISNNIRNRDCLFYTDARLVIGCVGAPVYR